MRLFILSFFIITQSYSEMKAVWSITKFENKDGTWGVKDKEILTSLSLITLLSHGETANTKHFGQNVKKMMQALVKIEKKLVKDKNLTIKHAYVLWALSEAYLRTGESSLEESCESLSTFALKYCTETIWIKADKESFTFFSNILSSAFYACKQAGLKSVEHINLKAMMKNAISTSCLNCAMLNKDKIRLMQIAARWDIDLTNLLVLPTPEMKFEKHDYEKINEITKKLNGNSKSRKLVQNDIKNLPAKLYLLLIRELKKSTITELQEMAKDLSKSFQLEPLTNQSFLFEEFKNSPSTFFSATAYYCIQNRADWKNWHSLLSPYWCDLQEKDGFWSAPSLTTPEFLKLSDKEKVLFNTCYANINLSAFYGYLPGLKAHLGDKVIREELDIVE